MLISQTTFVLCFSVSSKAVAASKTYTMNDLKNDLKARQVQEDAKTLNDFYKKIEKTVKDSLALQQQPGNVTVYQLPSGEKTGPKLLPFSSIGKKKGLNNHGFVSNTEQIEQLIFLNNENNRKMGELLFWIKGGFILGLPSGVETIRKILKIGAAGKKVLDDVLKEKIEGRNEVEKTKEKELNRFLDVFSKIMPILPILVILGILYPKANKAFPKAIKEYLPFKEKKSFLSNAWEVLTNFRTPTPYIIIGGTIIGGAFLIRYKNPDSTVANMLDKMIETTNKSIANFTALTYKMFDENLNRFKDVQKESDLNKDNQIKDLKKRNESLEKENRVARDQFHKLELNDVKTKYLLEDCGNKVKNYDNYFNQHKDYLREYQVDEKSKQKLINSPDSTPTPLIDDGKKNEGEMIEGGVIEAGEKKKISSEELEFQISILEKQMEIGSKNPTDKYFAHLEKERILFSVDSKELTTGEKHGATAASDNGESVGELNFWQEFWKNFANGTPGRIM